MDLTNWVCGYRDHCEATTAPLKPCRPLLVITDYSCTTEPKGPLAKAGAIVSSPTTEEKPSHPSTHSLA